MTLYPFQESVYHLLTNGRSVILQAPTGAGKTRAALYPFLRAWEQNADFPRKCIYSVPLRVLANQFWEEYQQRTHNFGFVQPLDVSIQTGARSEDSKLEGNLIFTTIDQTLSNFLNIPYALSLNQGNLNAGAVLSSYLVFDELHLFDPETTLQTTLHLLRLLRGVVPFLVMTATFSAEWIKALAKELDAEPLVVSAEEASAIPSQQKTRRIQAVDSELTAKQVIAAHRNRSIAICNTVDRAQTLFDGIRGLVDSDVEVRLLHSRFLRSDRERSEDWLRREFGKDRSKQTVDSAILIATQVVEVGLDISSETLHTELAPAASIIQRAGRCARYQGEEGDVFVYRLPLDKKGGPSYAPYHTGGQKEVSGRTWTAFQTRSGQVFDFSKELDVVNEAHHIADQALIERLQANRHYISQQIAETIASQTRGAAPELIRGVDSRTIIVNPQPKDIENPWDYQGFGIHRGSLFGAYEDLEMLAADMGEEWVMMTADALPEDPESSRSRTVYRWRDISSKDDLVGALLVAINPALTRYSPEIGFQLGLPGGPQWQSPLNSNTHRQRDFPPYRRETLAEHVRRMTRVYEHSFYDRRAKKMRLGLAEELAYTARNLERLQDWPSGTLDRLVRLVIASHDLGKLDKRWQKWAHQWQAEVSKLREADFTIPIEYLAAHTDFDSHNPAEKEANNRMRHLRPHHAAESAAAAKEWLLRQVNDQTLIRAALTAIIRHHNAGTNGRNDAFEAPSLARTAFPQILVEAGLTSTAADGVTWSMPAGDSLVNQQVRPERKAELLSYLLLVRTLRLADQRSQEWRD